MNEPQAALPSLPQYPAPNGPPRANKDQAGPIMKMMGKMLAKKLPRLTKNPKIHSQSVTIKHKRVRYW